MSGEDALARIRRLIAEGGMTAVVQREQSTTMASMGGFGNNIIVSHRIHRGSQTGSGASRAGPSGLPTDGPGPSTSGPLLITQTQGATPAYGSQRLPDAPVPGGSPPPPDVSLVDDLDDLFDGGRTDEDSLLPGPPSSSSLLLSSPSPSSSSSSTSSISSSTSHSPLAGGGAGGGAGPAPSYPDDLYSR